MLVFIHVCIFWECVIYMWYILGICIYMYMCIGHDGRVYAVKVQHSYLRDYSQGDMVAITAVLQLLSRLFPELFQYEWLIREMNRNLPIELDFRYTLA